MDKKYTHLFFDLDNTIWDFDSNSFDALKAALNKIGLLDKIGCYDDYYKIFDSVNERFWALYREEKTSKRILRVQRFEESFEQHGTPLPGMGEMVNEAYLAEMPLLIKLVDGARELLDYLHGKYEMAIITNGFRDVQIKKINQSGLHKYFKKLFISEEIGAQKPRKEIFEHAIKSMNARKMSSLMIGDSWEADIEGAKRFGIDQIYFSPQQDLSVQGTTGSIAITNQPGNTVSDQSKADKTSTIIISSLSELMEIL